jgi:hypothetical protein
LRSSGWREKHLLAECPGLPQCEQVQTPDAGTVDGADARGEAKLGLDGSAAAAAAAAAAGGVFSLGFDTSYPSFLKAKSRALRVLGSFTSGAAGAFTVVAERRSWSL